ncbi:MAG: TonB-dependent receptor [Pseudomonadota bacterium]|nr:TonB-dependent receptor [Pseudomonadota bacterium]
MRKSYWLLSAGLFALAAPAHAQTAPETDTDQGGAVATQGATSEGAAVDLEAVEQQSVDTSDIVVTATRRNEALSDIPLAVSAVTAETLEYSGANDIRQVQQVSPSLLVSSTSSEAGAGVARIRGIGTVGDNPGLESSVGVFIDGVYRSRTGVGLTELGQVDRIEVLRGPQGTLFGRNTSAGLISILTAKPRFTPFVAGQLDLGNYDHRRVELSANAPFSDTFAGRIDGIYMKRDGFLEDVVSGRRVNDRDRYLLRAQGLYQPTDDLSVRIIGDYSKRDEECCAAPFLPARDVNAVGGEAVEGPSIIETIENGLGAQIQDDPFERRVSITPGRNYRSDVKDGGLSAEVVYDFGGAEFTSITAYRTNKFVRGQDADYNALDILYRDGDGGAFNRFRTFSQEARLQGETFGGRLDWLVGGYFANEKLRVVDNLAYGEDYERYANCLVANNFAQVTNQFGLIDTNNPTCFNPAVAGALLPFVGPSATALSAFARLGPFAAPFFNNSGFNNLSIALGAGPRSLNGSSVDDRFDQTSKNMAVFTHNIFEIADGLKATVGLRYTREKKTLDADLADVGGSVCNLFGTGTPGLGALQQIPCVIPTLPGGTFSEKDSKTENKLSGTAVLSYKPTDELLTYASYSRGYKAGGFNLDRSAFNRFVALNSAGVPVAGAVTPAASLDDLKFKPETNEAFELGAKYNGRGIDVNVAVFRQLFKNFQLNTFNGINFFVESVNSCSEDLDDLDEDNSQIVPTGECTGKTRAGVKSQGVEVEVFTRPMTDVRFNVGGVYSDTRYRDDLVGANGQALSPALFQLPGRRLSNAAALTVTSSLAYTPRIGASGMSALFYVDGRYMSQFNTGSDLDIEKLQDSYKVINARVGLHGPNEAWGIELWANNLFDEEYQQVAFDAPLQGSCTTRGALNGFCSPVPNRSTQLFGAFLSEPRTYGLTLRAKWGPSAAPAPVYVAPPAPPMAPATQTCPDGTVILATEVCPLPPAPPPPPPSGERG